MSVEQDVGLVQPADPRWRPPGVIRTEETHTAVLYFTEDLVYKRKKPLDLGFLDFRDRAARLAACQAEVELNRRLAPDVYLGVMDVRDEHGQVCDHMVVMRRMPASRQLARLVRAGFRVDEQLRGIARTVAAFHERCETSEEISDAGSQATLEGLWREGLAGLAPFRGTVLDAGLVDEIGRLALRYLAGRGPLLAERQRAGRIRDGHGDLQAEDIYCLDDGPRILDCLEFDRRFRVGDVLGDIAFLAMDLERLGAPDEAERLMAWYREFSGETHPPSLEHLYIAYRAFVRAKVRCIRGAQGDPDAGEQARRLADLAYRHLRRGRVRLVLVGGLPGTGKSTLAGRLAAAEDGRVLLRSDVIRKELTSANGPWAAAAATAPAAAASPGGRAAGTGLGNAPLDGADPGRRHTEPGIGEGIYRPEVTQATYIELLRRARRALERGETVILDASWSTSAQRAAAARLADETSADLIELRCVTSPEVAAARIARRAAGNDPSDATPAVARAMAAWADPWPTAKVIQTSVPVGEALGVAERYLA